VTGAFTLEAWIHPLGWGEASVGFGRILNKNNLLLFLELGGMLVIDIDHSDGSSSRTNTSLGTITLNNWQHIAAVYSGATSDLKIYINGSPQVLNTPDKINGPVVSDPSSPLVIGNNGARTRTFDGMIDELRIWNLARTLPDIQGAMYDTLRGNESGLVANWRFDEGSGSQVVDRSSNRNSGSLQAAQWRRGWISPLTTVPGITPWMPSAFILAQNYPNPFNPSTTIRYGLPLRSHVTLAIFNTLGQQVAQLADGDREAGHHQVQFEGKELSSGVYFYRLTAGDFVATKRLILLK
jgi:hypothetical protein